jgi:rhodanese-related sulfurtransferase
MSDAKRIPPAEAHAKMQAGYTYVDVRTAAEFAGGHPEGAVNVTLGDGFLAAMNARFAKDAKIVVGCKSGGRSARAAAALAADGFTDVFDQRAGFDGARNAFGQIVEPGWSRAGLPVE